MIRFPAELVAILFIAPANAGPPPFMANAGLPENGARAMVHTPDGDFRWGYFNGPVRFIAPGFKDFYPGTAVRWTNPGSFGGFPIAGFLEVRGPAGTESKGKRLWLAAVSPQFWETSWFRGGATVLLIATGAVTAGWIIKLRHAHALETVEINKQREEIAHLSRVAALNELSGSLAHELNQPLAIILSNAQAAMRLLKQNPVAVEELNDILTDIVAEDRRAGEVIRRLRAMLKRGESAPRPEFISVIVEDVLTLTRSDLINRGVTVETWYAPELPPVMADRIQIQQVLLNLIINACDSMASNEPHLRRLKISTAEQKGQVHVKVSDEGCGLPAGDPDQIFKAFFTTKDYGLGMGLTICKSIANAHHGFLSAEPNAPRGSTFQLVLPVAPSV